VVSTLSLDTTTECPYTIDHNPLEGHQDNNLIWSPDHQDTVYPAQTGDHRVSTDRLTSIKGNLYDIMNVTQPKK